jgi:hypothetical protein
MKMTRSPEKPLLSVLLKRAALFFFGMSGVSLFLYTAGNAQGFTEKALRLSLAIAGLTGVALCFAAIAGVFSSIIFFFLGKIKSPADILRYILFGVFGAAAAIFSQFITVLASF